MADTPIELAHGQDTPSDRPPDATADPAAGIDPSHEDEQFDAPPPIRVNAGRAITIISCGVALAVLLFIVIINIESPSVRDAGAANSASGNVTELVGGDGFNAAGSIDDLNVSDFEVRGGWIQIADDQGRLSQQYRFARHDPNPAGKGPGWSNLVEPEAELYLAENRVVTLTGDEAMAYAPDGALEQGAISGNVVIRLFELDRHRAIDPDQDKPVLTVHTSDAQFDNFVGEVTCVGKVRVSSAQVELPGEDLQVLINDQDDQFTMRIARVDYVKVNANTDDEQSASAAPDDKQHDDATPDAPTPTYYRLTLSENVRILATGQADDLSTEAPQREIQADVLIADFSTASKGLGGALARAAGAPMDIALASRRSGARASATHGIHGDGSANAARSVASMLAAVTMGSLGAPNGVVKQSEGPPVARDENTVLITFDGPLIVQPIGSRALSSADAATLQPMHQSPDEIVLELTGAPVRIIDHAEQARATAPVLRYMTEAGFVELTGDDNASVHVNNREFEASAQRFTLDQHTGDAHFTGRGWLTPNDAAAFTATNAAAQDARPKPNDAARLLEELNITWEKGVDLAFDTDNASAGDTIGRLKQITFNGDVRVRSEDGDIFCQRLQLDVGVDDQGKPVPERMLATEQVKITDRFRTMWADDLTVAFARTPATNDAEQDQRLSARIGDDTMIRNLLATGDVQVLLSDGTRAFADKMIGDGVAETIELVGENVLIASGPMLAERGTSLLFSQKDETAHWNGGGGMHMFSQPFATGADSRIPRPSIGQQEDPPVVEAAWSTSMLYDNAANDGAGALDLRGDVFAISTEDPRDYSRIEGQHVRVDFAHEQDGDAENAAPKREDVDPMPDEQTLLDLESRQLERFTATGQAQLENRSLRADQPVGAKPRLFRVAGPHIEFDNQTGEALVEGAGELFMRGGSEPASAVEAADRPMDGLFRGQGQTMFRWKSKLHMRADGDGPPERKRITMLGDVYALHTTMAYGEIVDSALLTGDRVDAWVDPVDESPDNDSAHAPAPAPAKTAGLSIAGPMQLARVEGNGGITVKAKSHDVSCDRFEYDVAMGVADLYGEPPNGLVRVLTENDSQPKQARHITWDLNNDRIVVRRGSGGR